VPGTEVPKDLLDHPRVINHAEDPHRASVRTDTCMNHVLFGFGLLAQPEIQLIAPNEVRDGIVSGNDAIIRGKCRPVSCG